MDCYNAYNGRLIIGVGRLRKYWGGGGGGGLEYWVGGQGGRQIPSRHMTS